MSGRLWYADAEPVTCVQCGSTEWSTYESFSGSDRLQLRMAPGVGVDAKPRYGLDVEGAKYNADRDPWECENGHHATDEQEELLDDIRSNAS